MKQYEALHLRASLYAKIRQFFYEKNVMEVETPVFSRFGNTDPQIHSLCAGFSLISDPTDLRYAHTSPEFAMKRLLANGVDSIYQICKVFRVGECGRLHNPEFSMLEWYRVGFTYHRLMDEVSTLLAVVGISSEPRRVTYQQLFMEHFQIDVRVASLKQLKACARQCGIDVVGMSDDRDEWFDLLMSHAIEPHLGHDAPLFVYDYPASQAALANIRQHPYPVAERFELYINGVELANGYQELVDREAYQTRFESDNAKRIAKGLIEMPFDENLLHDLRKGFPQCSGVALGLDRLLMVLCQSADIADVIISDDVCN